MLPNKLNYGDTIGVVGVSNSISNRKERLTQSLYFFKGIYTVAQ